MEIHKRWDNVFVFLSASDKVGCTVQDGVCQFVVLGAPPACLVFKVLHDLASPYLDVSIQRYQPVRSLHSASKDLLVVPEIWTQQLGARSFLYTAPLVYNTLLLNVHQAPTLDSFKACLKTHVFTVAYD